MRHIITAATVCSGIGAPEEAAKGLGYKFVFCSEIEPFPSAVMKYRHPEVPNLGDMTKIDGEKYNGKIKYILFRDR